MHSESRPKAAPETAPPIVPPVPGSEKAEGTMLDWALWYARQGIRVLPVHEPIFTPVGCTCREGTACKKRGKHPRIGGWQHEATTDEATIRRWWGHWPTANIGGLTGETFDVLDIDGEQGRAVLKWLVEAHGELPPSPVSLTGSGGEHRLFGAAGTRNSASKIGDKLDWRGYGGQAVLPPSLHETGDRYGWLVRPDECPVPAPPPWLAMLATRDSEPLTEEKRGPVEARVMEPGKDRNDTLYRFAFKTRANQPHLSEGEVFAVTWAHNVDPSVSPAPLDEQEVRTLVHSAMRAQQAAPGNRYDAPKPVPSGGPRGWQIGALMAHEFPPLRWWIDGFLPAQGFATIVGARKAGKSTLTLEMALCIATGTPFLGQPVAQCPAILIEEEGTEQNFQDRAKAQAAALGIKVTDDTPLYAFIRERFRLDDAEWLAEIERLVAERGAKVVLIGPLAQVVSLESENDNAGMQRLARGVGALTAKLGILLALAHHTRKPNDKYPAVGVEGHIDMSRGAGALMDAVDSGIVIARKLGDTGGSVYVMHRAAPEASYRIRFINDDPATQAFEIDTSVPESAGDLGSKLEAALKVLRALGGWQTTPKIATKLKLTEKPTKGRLDQLVGEGLVEHRKGEKNAHEWRAFTEPEVAEREAARYEGSGHAAE